jgi:hypothetical protein
MRVVASFGVVLLTGAALADGKPVPAQPPKAKAPAAVPRASVSAAPANSAGPGTPQRVLTEEEFEMLAKLGSARAMPNAVPAAERPAVLAVIARFKKGNRAQALGSWHALVKRLAQVEAEKPSAKVPIEELAAWVLRETYVSSLSEMAAIVDKVRYLSEAKQALRQDISRLRAAAQGAGAAPVSVSLASLRSTYTQNQAAVVGQRSEQLTRDQVKQRITELESAQEEVRNRREASTAAFRSFDQKANQLYQTLSNIVKTMAEMRAGTNNAL